jgi:hypothetical protein
MREPFRRREDGIEVRLRAQERAVLRSVPGMLAALEDDEDAQARLNPPAHRDDPAAAEEFRALVSADLARERAADRERFAATIGRRTIADADAEAWLRVVGDLRLVLGTRLGIDQDDWETDPSLGGSTEAALLHYLGYLQDGLARVLGAGL